MNLLDMTFKRQTYEIEIKQSILFECALGIAVITYPQIQATLEKPKLYWDRLNGDLPKSLQAELDYCQQNNTWKILLQLLHQRNFESLDSFLTYIKGLDDEQIRYKALPFLGDSQQDHRSMAAKGNKKAMNNLIATCKGHLFFPQLIRFICEVNVGKLRRHLLLVMGEWYKTIIAQKEELLTGILQRDYEVKLNRVSKLHPEEFVQWATGSEYQPEPTITKVLLIPHYVYRPWTVQAEIEGTKIFYYPIADESLEEEVDIYKPNLSLVQRYKALGDENRLRIVKLLFEKDRTLKELTEVLDIGKTTIHHHLTLLRSAHIVKTKGSHYVLNHHSLSVDEKEFMPYLQRKS
jgi:hypothetical protein